MAKIHTKFHKLMLIGILLIATIFTTAPQIGHAASTTETYKVNASSLNVRTGPSTSYKVSFALKKNSTVTKISTSGNWFKIKSGSKTGYASSKYLTKVKATTVATASTPKVTTYFYVTEPTGLTIRSGASVSYKSLGTIPAEKKVQILSENKNGWIRITYNKKTGWINANSKYGFKSTKSFSYKIEEDDGTTYYLIMQGNSLNVRKLPNTAAPSLGKIGNGYTAKILRSASNGWVEIQYSNSVKGWVSTNTELTVVTDSIGQVGDDLEGSLTGLTFVIDAGHGNGDSGASGRDLKGNLVYEKTLNLKAAQAIQTAIQNIGGKVLMTRTNDTFLTLDQRAKYAIGKNANAFISVHHNSASSSAVGYETYYSNKTSSKAFAKAVHEGVIEAVQEEYPQVKDRQLKAMDYYVVRYNSVYASLLELGFVSNPTELSRLNTNKFRNTVAEGVVNGLLEFYGR
ncbi:MAG: N-acetylmuramoyl-L-alanine amidase [Kurthia sp.]|nr:N-acetylmuramoyl-L-alanine amidase [Candidatus Kurthia equi]